MNKFLKEFKDRGYFYQCTNENELSNLLDKKSINAYIGFDSTAASLHVGSLMQIMCLKLLQKHGHRPIVLLGGGTTRIGDPSGKEETRKILSEKEIENNINLKKSIHESTIELWNFCKRELQSGENDQIILDEIFLALAMKIIDKDDLISTLENRFISGDVILTGTDIPKDLLLMANQITELRS